MNADEFTTALALGNWVTYHSTKNAKTWAELIDANDRNAKELQAVLNQYLKSEEVFLCQKKNITDEGKVYYEYKARLIQ